MNPATLVTASRIALSPVFFFLFTMGVREGTAAALVLLGLWVLFAVIEASDFLDGLVARRTGSVTDLGKVFDPFADSFARLTYFLSFVVTGLMPPWIFLLVLYRDLGVSFVRLLSMKHGVAMSAQLSGKIKAWVYAIAGGAGLAAVTAASLAPASVAGILGTIAQVSFWACAATAVWTMIDYVMAYRAMRAGTPR
jgi:CDP-diacylglycerol--glycerol-3-phosphate 3-phosphatidyltransferase